MSTCNRQVVMETYRLILLVIGIKHASCQCTPNNTEITIDGYRLTRTDTASPYEQAIDNCRTNYNSSILAIIKTPLRQKFVEGIIRGCFKEGVTDFLIGLKYQNGSWYWVDGEILSKEEEYWRSGSGENNQGGSCAMVRADGSLDAGRWVNTPCASYIRPICQRDLLILSVDNESSIAVNSGRAVLNVSVYSYDGPDPVIVTLSKISSDGSVTVLKEYIAKVEDELKYEFVQASLNDSGEYRFFATKSTYNRTTSIHLTIHEPVKIVYIKPSSASVPIPTNRQDFVNCSASGVPFPSVTWKRYGNKVNPSNGSDVYQIIGDSVSILYFGNATQKDHGKYECVAVNYITNQKQKMEDTAVVNLIVYGKPIIDQNSSALNCTEDAAIYVWWKKGKYAISELHSIKISENSATGLKIVHEENVTTLAIEELTVVDNLKAYTEYEIMVTACPDDYCFPEKLSDKRILTTGIGRPKKVENASATSQNTEACTVSWVWKDIYPNDVVEFQVNEKSVLVHVRPGFQGQKVFSVIGNWSTGILYSQSNEFLANLVLESNRNYTFSLRVRTCDNDATKSESVDVLGFCVTEVSAPKTIVAPIVKDYEPSTESQRKISVIVPYEDFGPISCLFVVVKIGGGLINVTTVETLAKLYQNNPSTEPTNGTEYIALAVPMSYVYIMESFSVTLGNGSQSSCDSEDIVPPITRSIYYNGKNWPLKAGSRYSFVVVSTTPNNGDNFTKVYVTQSITQTFVQEKVDVAEDKDLWWTIGVIAASLLLILYFYLIFRYIKTERVKDQQGYINPESTEISIKYFKSRFIKLNENDGKEFKEQYSELKSQCDRKFEPSEIGTRESTKKKNRYKNILPYEASRVALKGNETESYINASFINGYDKDKKFIATQGPLPTTVEDFWRMVLEQECRVIVMTTQVVESGKTKCQKYWPDEFKAERYGNVSVKSTLEQQFGGFVKREFTVQNCVSEIRVVQLQYLEWPDHGVPITTSTFVRFYKACMNAQGSYSSPIIVHCSAGAGRTGTFIAYDILSHESQQRKYIDVYQCVVKIREQRMDMVQTCDQYKFLHRLIMEQQMLGETDLSADDFFTKSRQDDSQRIKNLFNGLKELLLMPRIINESGCISMRVPITWAPEDGETIVRYDATRLETYDRNFTLIAAASPSASTSEAFWRLILDNEISCLVSLGDRKREDSLNDCSPTEDHLYKEFGNISLDLILSEEKKHVAARNIIIRRVKQKREIRHFNVVDWNPAVAVKIIRDITNLASHTSDTDNFAVLVHCGQGFGEIGSFCTIFNAISRLKTEDRVDVFRTIKDLGEYNTGLVTDTHQYKFCCDAIKQYKMTKRSDVASVLGNEYAYQDFPMTTTL